MHFLTSGQFVSASSVVAFKGIVFPPLTPSSAVIIYSDLQSFTLPEIESAENPPNIIECIAPTVSYTHLTLPTNREV